MTGLRPVLRRDEGEVRAYLAAAEPAATMIIERAFHAGGLRIPSHLLANRTTTHLEGILYANNHGLLLPLGLTLEGPPPQGFPHPFALVGLDADVRPILPHLPSPRLHWDYESLFLPSPSPPNTLARPLFNLPMPGQSTEGIHFRRASIADLDAVLPLQCAYEVEEVLAPGMPLRTDATRLVLAGHLERGLVVVAKAGSRIVAKAGLNAVGFRFAQVGGVYTLPEWRNRGLASRLMNFLVQAMVAGGWGCTLFVKTRNLAALQVYRGLGFQPSGAFSVVYF